MHGNISATISVLQKLEKALKTPEPAITVAERMLTAINKALELEGQKIIKNGDALSLIRDTLANMIENDRLARINSAEPSSPYHVFGID